MTVLDCIKTLLFMNWIYSTLDCNELLNTLKVPVLSFIRFLSAQKEVTSQTD